MWKILNESRKYNEKAIKRTYKLVRAKVQITRSWEFKMNKRIQKGEELSPLLLIIVMDNIIKK